MSEDSRPQTYSVRLNPELRHHLETAAKAAGRSLHAEILMRLSASLGNNFESFNSGVQSSLIQLIREIAGEVAEQKFHDRTLKRG
ncbi:TraY domain-containing protein [Thiothrix sp.]|uniref:TraY domain-containing protein n=1 Tax=Thiothrix sp. TaxID=1032 RepID=UPI00343D2132